jgi:hypothetical protein
MRLVFAISGHTSFPTVDGLVFLPHRIARGLGEEDAIGAGQRKSRPGMDVPSSGMVDDSGPNLCKPPDTKAMDGLKLSKSRMKS